METEVTVQVFNTLEETLKILKKQGFTITERFELDDWYYSTYTKEEARKTEYQDLIASSLLVRKVINENKIEHLLFYKNKQLDSCGNVIAETKIGTKIESCEKVCKMLTSINMKEWCSIKNKSVVVTNDKMQFCLQDIEGLGLFIEYEEKDRHKGLSSTEKFKTLSEELKSLNLKIGNDFSCKKPYLVLHSL